MKRSELSGLSAEDRAEVERQMAGPDHVGDAAEMVARPPSHTPGKMNKGERRYRDFLDGLLLCGQIKAFRFEAVRLELADRCTLLPDFFVVLPDDSIEFREVKGRKGESFYCREDAWIKLKVSAREYPFWTFKVCWPAPGSAGWRERIVTP